MDKYRLLLPNSVPRNFVDTVRYLQWWVAAGLALCLKVVSSILSCCVLLPRPPDTATQTQTQSAVSRVTQRSRGRGRALLLVTQ